MLSYLFTMNIPQKIPKRNLVILSAAQLSVTGHVYVILQFSVFHFPFVFLESCQMLMLFALGRVHCTV